MSAKQLVAIHQPNFVPWIGYFDKIWRSDTFIFLDDAELSRGSVTNRVRILVSGNAHWLTCPVASHLGSSVGISEAMFVEDVRWKKKNFQMLQSCYGWHPYFAEVFEVLEPCLMSPVNRMVDYNISLVLKICEGLGVGGHRFVSASKQGVESDSTKRLVDLVKSVGANSYLTGGGASGYQNNDLFRSHGLQLVDQNFEPKPYPQKGSV